MIETKFDIGDVVFTGTAYGVDKDIIKAIKVTGLNKSVQYGFPTKADRLFSLWMGGDNYNWYKSSEIFSTETQATKHSEKLKSKKAEQEQLEKQAKAIKRKSDLEAELKQLEAGVDPDDIQMDEDY